MALRHPADFAGIYSYVPLAYTIFTLIELSTLATATRLSALSSISC